MLEKIELFDNGESQIFALSTPAYHCQSPLSL